MNEENICLYCGKQKKEFKKNIFIILKNNIINFFNNEIYTTKLQKEIFEYKLKIAKLNVTYKNEITKLNITYKNEINIIKNKLKEYENNYKSLDKKYKYEIIEFKGNELLVNKYKFNRFERIKEKILGKKPKFYIGFINSSGNLEILKIYEENTTLIKENSRFELFKRIAFFNGLPFYIVHNECIISAEFNDNKTALIWNPKTYYNIIEHIIRRKLTVGDKEFNFMDFFKKYWLIIIIIIIILVIFASPQGKQFINDLVKTIKP